jgi:hypothetical protein
MNNSMRIMPKVVLLVGMMLLPMGRGSQAAESPWVTLFNGKDLTGWKANLQPDSFKVVDGAIRAQSTKDRVHLFYVGEEKDGKAERFKNFELMATVRGEPNANSGIFFHTDTSVRDVKNHLAKGYEVQLNSSEKEKRKTGSLYAIVDLDKSPVDESKWFNVYIRVEGKRILVKINDQVTVDYTEPEKPERPPERKERLLDPQGGAIALQAHDPGSVFYFKDIQVRKLP